MAAKSTRNAHLVHGTLLIDADLGKLNSLCVAPPDCPPVSNLKKWSPYVDEEMLEQTIIAQLAETDYDVAPVSRLYTG